MRDLRHRRTEVADVPGASFLYVISRNRRESLHKRRIKLHVLFFVVFVSIQVRPVAHQEPLELFPVLLNELRLRVRRVILHQLVYLLKLKFALLHLRSEPVGGGRGEVGESGRA